MMSTENIQTAGDLMSVALQAEHEAVQRYTQLAETMHRSGNQEVASLFQRMAEEERQHERLIEEWAKLESVQLRTDIGAVAWKDPQIPTDYDDEAVDPVHSTPYRVLAFAAHNEERAFHFYTHVAATAEDATVRGYAETLAREELGHATLLRAMRRRAWRFEQKNRRNEPEIEPGAIHSLADLLAIAASIEHCFADNMNTLSENYPQLQTLNAALKCQLKDIESQRKTAGQAGEGIAAIVDSIDAYTKNTAAKNDDAQFSLQRMCSDSDRCFAFYDAVVTGSKEEDVMLAAQQLSKSALERVGVLRSALGAQSG